MGTGKPAGHTKGFPAMTTATYAVRVCWNAYGEVNDRTVGFHCTRSDAEEQIGYLTIEDDEWTTIVELDQDGEVIR